MTTIGECELSPTDKIVVTVRPSRGTRPEQVVIRRYARVHADGEWNETDSIAFPRRAPEVNRINGLLYRSVYEPLPDELCTHEAVDSTEEGGI